MEGDGTQRIAEGDEGDEQHLIHDRGVTAAGKEIDHVGDAVFEAREDKDGNAEHRDHGVAEHVRRFLPDYHAGIHQHAAHERREEDMEGEVGDIGYQLTLLQKNGRGGNAEIGKLQAGAIEERADQVAEIDDTHVLEREGVFQEADGSGIELELEVYDSEQAKGEEQAAYYGDLYAHQSRSAYADEYPCPDGTDEHGDQCSPRMVSFSHSVPLEKHTSPTLPRVEHKKTCCVMRASLFFSNENAPGHIT